MSLRLTSQRFVGSGVLFCCNIFLIAFRCVSSPQLYSSSTDENDEKKRLEGIASYRKVDGEPSSRINNNNNHAKRNKSRAKSPLKFQNHELELSCTERIARQRYPSANYQVIPPSRLTPALFAGRFRTDSNVHCAPIYSGNTHIRPETNDSSTTDRRS